MLCNFKMPPPLRTSVALPESWCLITLFLRELSYLAKYSLCMASHLLMAMSRMVSHICTCLLVEVKRSLPLPLTWESLRKEDMEV